MMDIREFLEARLAEDEAIARDALHPDAVNPGEWMTEHHEGDPPTCHIAEDRTGHYWSVAHEVFVPNGLHIARHDPARVLVDVASSRKLLELAAFLMVWSAEHVATVTEPEIKSMRFAGREILRQLATRWSDHPDYDPAWSPESVIPPQ